MCSRFLFLSLKIDFIVLRFYLFRKYEFVNCKQSKHKYVFQFQLKPLLFSLLMCHCSNLCYEYNSNYNNNYSFVILIYLQPCYKPYLYFIVHTTEMFKLATLHKTVWITNDSRALCLVFLYTHTSCPQNVLKVGSS